MKRRPNCLIPNALCVLLLVTGTCLSASSLSAQPSNARVSNGTVAGLEAPGEIIVDVWGIPHHLCRQRTRLFLLQGYNAARDRLWQIDLWRKRGLGLLAQDFGPAYVEQDRALRLFLYRGDMAAEWAAYGPEGEDRCGSVRRRGQRLCRATCGPASAAADREFTIAGTMPDPGRPRTSCASAATA